MSFTDAPISLIRTKSRIPSSWLQFTIMRPRAVRKASGRAIGCISFGIRPIYAKEYTVSMKKTWDNPAKHPPKQETMNTPGNFEAFTDLMRKIVEKPKTVSPGPVSS